MNEETATARRRLTPEVREQLDLPRSDARPYRWSFAAFVVAVAAVPLLFAGLFRPLVALIVVAFGVVPGVRWYERREARLREEVYSSGDEAVGRVIDVEPAGPGGGDDTIRLEFWARQTLVRASVTGSRLARQGLAPGDDVVVVYDRDRPARCLLLERIKRV